MPSMSQTDLARLRERSGCDARTIARVYAGFPVRHVSRRRIESAARELGIISPPTPKTAVKAA